MAIIHANSSGQGFDIDHNGAFASIIRSFGYGYSHSTPVVHMGGARIIHHTYAHGEHRVSWWRPGAIGSEQWSSTVSCASGRHTTGSGALSLVKHLMGKAKRYPELRGKRP